MAGVPRGMARNSNGKEARGVELVNRGVKLICMQAKDDGTKRQPPFGSV